MTKRMLLTLFFGFALSSLLLAADNVVMEPLINFDGMFEDLRKFFTDVLKENWVFLLSLFFLWFGLESAKAFLDGKAERIRAENEREKRITKQVNRAEEKREVQRRLREREIERDFATIEYEYNSREMTDRFGNKASKEKFYVDANGKHYRVVQSALEGASDVRYVPVSTSGNEYSQDVSGFWQYDEEEDDVSDYFYDPLDEPIHFDFGDNDKVYDSVVESDYEYREFTVDEDGKMKEVSAKIFGKERNWHRKKERSREEEYSGY